METKLNLNTLIELFSVFSSIFLIFFMILASLINQDIKVVIYLGWALFGAFATILFVRPMYKILFGGSPSTESHFCNVFMLPDFGSSLQPSLSGVFLSFTFTYILAPMFNYNNSINYPFGLSLFVLFLLNAFHRTSYQCNTFFSEFVIAPIVGLSVGLLAVYIMVYSDNKALLYYDELVSNKQSCGRPQKQYYRCTIKGGDTISLSSLSDEDKQNILTSKVTIKSAINDYIKNYTNTVLEAKLENQINQINTRIDDHKTNYHSESNN